MKTNGAKVQEVKDKIAEIGINLSALIQGMILLSIAWLGNHIIGGLDELNINVKDLTAQIAESNTSIRLNESEIDHVLTMARDNRLMINQNREKITEHIREEDK